MYVKKKKKKLFRKELQFYFASSLGTFLLSFVSAVLFFIFILFLYAYEAMTSLYVCLGFMCVLLADAFNILVMDDENIWHFHLFRFSAPVLQIPLRGITHVATSLEKKKQVVFIGGAYTHVTVAKNKKLWEALLAHLNLPQEQLQECLRCESGKYHKKTETVEFTSERVNVPQLIGNVDFISYTIDIQVSNEVRDDIYQEMKEKEEEKGKKFEKGVDTLEKR